MPSAILDELNKHVHTPATGQSITYYYSLAGRMVTTAVSLDVNNGDSHRAYIMYKRLIKLYLNIICKHNDFRNERYDKEKRYWSNKCENIMDRLEQITTQIKADEQGQTQATTVAAASISTASAAVFDGAHDDIAQRLSALGVSELPISEHAVNDVRVYAPEANIMPTPLQTALSGDISTDALAPSAPPEPTNNIRQSSWDNLRLPSSAPLKSPTPKRSIPTPPIQAAATPRTQIAPPPPPPQAAHSKLRPIHLPTQILSAFLGVAEQNTAANVETCAIICGRMSGAANDQLLVTHLIFPPQHGTDNTCVMHDEVALLEVQTEYDLMTFGWIHTHPSQSCFLSSVDLHTQYAYQICLDEAIAIVCAPLHTPNHGVFVCSQNGLSILSQCSRSGFHTHNTSKDGIEGGLFEQAQHVVWENNLKIIVIDMRFGKQVPPHSHTPSPVPTQPPTQRAPSSHAYAPLPPSRVVPPSNRPTAPYYQPTPPQAQYHPQARS